VTVSAGLQPSFEARERRVLFVFPEQTIHHDYERLYGVGVGDGRFLMMRRVHIDDASADNVLILVEDFFEEVRRSWRTGSGNHRAIRSVIELFCGHLHRSV
jgi:hypothetical protein